MIPRFQGLFGRRIVQVVGGADVHRLKSAGGVAGILIGKDPGHPVGLGHGLCLGLALGAAAQGGDFDLGHFGQMVHKLRHNAAGGQNGKFQRHEKLPPFVVFSLIFPVGTGRFFHYTPPRPRVQTGRSSSCFLPRPPL